MHLINADALIADIKECIEAKYDNYECEQARGLKVALSCVDNAPTIEPERKRGKWIDEGFYADGYGAHAFRCSECGGHIIEYDVDPFCKWCGADMRGAEK